MIYAQKTVGRMLEAAIASPVGRGNIDAFIQRVRMVVLAANEPLIAAVRMEQCPVLTPHDAEQYSVLIKRDNPRVHRVGYLLQRRGSPEAVQFEQLIKEGNNPQRKFFYTKQSIRSFLQDELTPTEVTRLDAFLAADLTKLR